MATVSILSMECKKLEDGLTDVVSLVYWLASDSITIDGRVYEVKGGGSTAMPPPNPQDYTPYEDLTEAQVVGWVEALTDINAFLLGIAERDASFYQPNQVSPPIPWE